MSGRSETEIDWKSAGQSKLTVRKASGPFDKKKSTWHFPANLPENFPDIL